MQAKKRKQQLSQVVAIMIRSACQSKLLLAMPFVALLSGCAMGPKYICPLDGSGDPRFCHSEPEIYRAGVKAPAEGFSVFGDPNKKQSKGQQKADAIPQKTDATQVVPTQKATTGDARVDHFFKDTNAPVADSDISYHYPIILKTWFNAYVDQGSNMAVSPHTVHWVFKKGGWSVPVSSKSTQSANVIKPFGKTPSGKPIHLN